MNSHFATENFFCKSFFEKILPCAKLQFGLSWFQTNWLFCPFLIFKNYKTIEETAQIFFNQTRTEYGIAKHIKID